MVPLVGTYRSREELVEWLERCPLKRLRERMQADDPGCESQLDAVDAEIEARITAVVEYAKSSSWPDPETVSEHVFAGGGAR